jgi:hypothetical protein
MPHASQDPDFERIIERSGQFEAARAAWPQFLVVRLGRDDANQPDRDRQALGFVPAPDAASAAAAAEEKWSLFTGQQFEVLPREQATAEDRASVERPDEWQLPR